MYQGKFDAKSRGHQSPKENLQNILKTRDAEKAAEAAKKTAPARPARQNPAAPVQRPTAGQNTVPAQKAASAPVRNPNGAQMPAQKKAPAAKPAVASPEKKRGPRVGSVIFYTVYFLFIFLFFGATFFGLQWLNGWLTDFEAAQPTVKSQEVFEELFANPDWEKLYQMAGVENTSYEGVEQYVAYMQEKVGDEKLNFVETSSGLSTDKKYIVRLGTEKIATFTLEGNDSITKIPDWQLGKVELFFSRQQGYMIQKLDGHTAYVNGVPLDDSFTIQIATTKADEFLPIGTPGVRLCLQSITGLMAKPTVTVFAPTGEEMPVEYDEEKGIFIEQTEATSMGEEPKELAIGAVRAYAEFMINANGSRAAVSKYYDGAEDAYKRIIKMASELWMNHDYGHSFINESVDGYVKYGENLFSIHAHSEMRVVLNGGTDERVYTIDMSLFFHQKNGKWVCFEMTNEDVTQPVGLVRLTFINNGTVLLTDFFNTNATQLITPVVSVPDGKVFSGWVKETYDENGRKTLTIVFTPDDSGRVTLNSGSSLEPMTLYALFEDAPAEGGEK